MNRLTSLAGLAAVLTYAATVLIGGWLTPGYSHLDQPVSALFALGAPYALPVSAAFILYNLLLIGFGAGLLGALRGPAAMILANGAIGIAIEFFPMDAPGAPVSAAGLIHIVLAAGLVATCTLAMALAAIGWYRQRRIAPASVTAALLIVMLAAGLVAAQAATGGAPFLGLFQRLTIGAYLLWIALLAVTTGRRAA